MRRYTATGVNTDQNMGALLAGYAKSYSYDTHPACSNDCEWSYQALKEEGYTTLFAAYMFWQDPTLKL